MTDRSSLPEGPPPTPVIRRSVRRGVTFVRQWLIPAVCGGGVTFLLIFRLFSWGQPLAWPPIVTMILMPFVLDLLLPFGRPIGTAGRRMWQRVLVFAGGAILMYVALAAMFSDLPTD